MKKTKDSIKDTMSVDKVVQSKAMLAIGDGLTKMDKDLAQFLACSALSTDNIKFMNTFSLCWSVYKIRTVKTETKLEKDSEDMIMLSVVDLILGQDAPLN